MDQETKTEFQKIGQEFQKMDARFDTLAGMMAEGFTAVTNRIDSLDFELKKEIAEIRGELKSIRAELERIPDNIDQTYSGTFNDLLERVSEIEKRLAAVETKR